MVSDRELMARALAGDGTAFDGIVLRYQDALFRHLLGLAGSREQAEDLCQEAFVRLYRALPRFDQGRPVAPLLFRIATNLWRDSRKRPSAIPATGEVEAPDCRTEVADRALQRLEREAIAEAVARLRWEYRAVISLRYDQGLSYREIAEAMRVAPGTVATWLHRALDALRAGLRESGREVGQ